MFSILLGRKTALTRDTLPRPPPPPTQKHLFFNAVVVIPLVYNKIYWSHIGEQWLLSLGCVLPEGAM